MTMRPTTSRVYAGLAGAFIIAILTATAVSAENPAAQPAKAEPTTPPATDQSSPVPLATALDPDDPVTRLLRQGKFMKALDLVNRTLNEPTPYLSRGLYQRGIARLALADRDNDQHLYKSAGLDFARVVTYFRRSPYRGAALLELGYVHQKIGRHDLAQQLFKRSGRLIRNDKDPQLVRRLDLLIAEQPKMPTGS